MKTFMTMVSMLAFVTTPLVPLAFAHGRPLPPAFGKELVPDSQAQGGDSKAAEIEEMREKEDEEVVRPRSHGGGGGHGKRVHIQLDGDEDGGGTDDGDGGEY